MLSENAVFTFVLFSNLLIYFSILIWLFTSWRLITYPSYSVICFGKSFFIFVNFSYSSLCFDFSFILSLFFVYDWVKYFILLCFFPLLMIIASFTLVIGREHYTLSSEAVIIEKSLRRAKGLEVRSFKWLRKNNIWSAKIIQHLSRYLFPIYIPFPHLKMFKENN